MKSHRLFITFNHILTHSATKFIAEVSYFAHLTRYSDFLMTALKDDHES